MKIIEDKKRLAKTNNPIKKWTKILIPHQRRSRDGRWAYEKIFHREIKAKQQWDTPTQLWEQPNSRTLTKPNAGNDVEQQELSLVASGKVKWYGTVLLENSLAAS